MGSPKEPDTQQYATLEKAGKLAEISGPEKLHIENGHATLQFTLPRQGVSLLVFEETSSNK
jgi:xylan 1,4-beta-xylosidase